MPSNRQYARPVDVTIEHLQSGLFIAYSEALPGLHIASRDLDAVQQDVPNVIRALYEHQGLNVVVMPLGVVDRDEDFPKNWVAAPREVAQEALQA